MAKERSKAIFFSFHIFLDKRVWVNMIVLLQPKLYFGALWKSAKCEVHCSSESSKYGN